MADADKHVALSENTPLKFKMADRDVTSTSLHQNGVDPPPSYTHNTPDTNTHTTTHTNANTLPHDGGTKQGEKKAGFKSLFSTFSGRRKYTLILITIASSLGGMAFSMLGPFFPQEATKKGMDISTVGLVFGIFEVVIFLTAPIYGSYLVKIGPRFVFIAGIFVGGSCNVEFKESVALIFGILETGTGLGFMIGPTIGGALYELGGFGLPFYFAGVAVLVNGMAVYRFLPVVEEVPTKRKGSIFTLLRSPMIVIPVGSVLVGVMGITTWDSTFAKHVEPMNFSIGLVGVLFGVVALVYSIMSSIWGYITDSKDIQAPLIVVGSFVYGVGFLLLGPSVLLPFLPFELPVILVGLAMIGISFGCSLVPTMKCMVIGAMELGFENNMDTFGLVSGLFNSVHTLGGFVGPVGVGYLIQEFDFPTGYTVIGMASIFISLVSLVFFSIRNFRKRGVYKFDHDIESDDTSSWSPLGDHHDVGSIRVPFSRSLSMSVGSI